MLPFISLAQLRPIKNTSSHKTSTISNANLNVQQNGIKSSQINSSRSGSYDTIPPIESYLVTDIHGNKTAVDTTLTIQNFYKHNYLQKDIFGLLPFANDGQTYTILDHTKESQTSLPSIGFQAKQYGFLDSEEINYYNVPTPHSHLFYRSAIKQGQNLDALLATNVSKQLNFFIGYRGLRSTGAYINQLTSIGNFRIGSSYDSKNNRYHLKAHIAVQDLTNYENGGIIELDLFENKEGNRERLDVRLRDAQSLYKNIRLFADNSYQLNTSQEHKVWLSHQVQYDYFSYLYHQKNAISQNLNDSFFGEFYSSSIYDKVRNENVFNKVELAFDSKRLGQFSVFSSLYQYNYYYNSIVIDSDDQVIPHQLKDNIINIGGAYVLKANNLDINLFASQSITEQVYTDIQAQTEIEILDKVTFDIHYQYASKIPEFTKQLFQSNFTHYNWYNDFSNEKTHHIRLDIKNPWLNLSANYKMITDRLYFSNDWNEYDGYNNPTRLLISPKQYHETINYLSLSAQKEFHWRNWALDNTFQFQQVAQNDDILNVPTLISRNTLYYSNYLFKKALYIQTGVTANYFTSYYMNGYNPVLGDFYIQNQTKIGNYPMIDFFLNMKIRTARIYFAVEQLNHLLGKSKHLSAPMYPYKDLTVRLGISWKFFN